VAPGRRCNDDRFGPDIGSKCIGSAHPQLEPELRQLASNVYAYTQASGPGIDNASLSNAGVIVGDDLLAIDALGPRFTPKPFIAAAKRATGKPFGRLVKTRAYLDLLIREVTKRYRAGMNGSCGTPCASTPSSTVR